MIRAATLFLLAFAACGLAEVPSEPAFLPGELSADEVLDGQYPFPPSPSVEVPINLQGLDKSRLGTVPAPGVHPRILISPDQLPDLRRRLKETNVGQALYKNLQQRLDASIRNPRYWGSELYRFLANGDAAGAEALIKEKKGLPPGIGHYQPFLYGIALEALDAMILEDADRGKKAATATATFAGLVLPVLENESSLPLHDDTWRIRPPAPDGEDPLSELGPRDTVGGHLLGYCYDFAYGWMSGPQRDLVRKTIAKATFGKLWMGARLPHHFRNWNWIAVGLQQPLLSLAIEGEEGFDPRIYKLGVEIARDYLTYGISGSGVSTEAVGYTQFGLVWANPFFVAAQRRGADLLGHGHHRAMLDWYLHSTTPVRDQWLSHGDGGDRGPSPGTLAMWRYFFPGDPKAEAVWRSFVNAGGEGALAEPFHIIEPLIWASDDPGLGKPLPAGNSDIAKIGIPPVLFDPVRGSLMARSGWGTDDASVEFECRVDSVGGSHEHADRGMFTFCALGRVWAKDNFRSVETRHHNNILIDGLGQGFWPGPGVWLGLQEVGDTLLASCDAKDAYAWFWPKQITTEDPETFARFQFPRWKDYKAEALALKKRTEGLAGEKDTRPAVVKFWKGFDKTGPRLWDEDSWPVRYPHNPVVKAFRTVLFQRGASPYLIVVDDIQKDDKEHLYEWLMQTGLNTEVASINGNDIVLCDATVKRNPQGSPSPQKGDRQLLVRVLQMNNPALARDYQSRPSFRLETFERKDTLLPESKGLSGSRSFGADKRLVIASRSVSPDFKVLLFPFQAGDPLPSTDWSDDRTKLTISAGGRKDVFAVSLSKDGRTEIAPLVSPRP